MIEFGMQLIRDQDLTEPISMNSNSEWNPHYTDMQLDLIYSLSVVVLNRLPRWH